MNRQSAAPLPAVELMELATGYQRSKTLFVIVELHLPTLLADAPLAVEELARQTKLHALACDRLINAGVALKLFTRDGDTISNTEMSATYLVEGKPGYLGEQFALYDSTSYPSWNELTKRLRQWRPGETDDETPQDEDQGADSMRAQHNLATLVGGALAHAFEFSEFHQMLDLGGGSGAMSVSICDAHENLKATVFDLPEVVAVAREFIANARLDDRIKTRDGNFKEDDLPGGFDIALLANLLSVSSAETNRKLFKRIYDQLPQGGAILLSGWILDDTRTSPLIPVLFCLEDINWQVPDVERAAATYQEWLRDAGFTNIERRMFHSPWSVIVGRKV
jgi:predicted O-methyltransferase YrrM